VDSTGETIDFMLLPKRDAVAAKHFLHWPCGVPDKSDRE
jgi:transposase-like protein